MRKAPLIVFWLLAMLICSTLPITAAMSGSVVRLPNSFVTMRAVAGIGAYFAMDISNVHSGFDVTNGTYQGWCVQKEMLMTQRVNHTVQLYSSYDPGMPRYFQSSNWGKINYVINHEHGGRMSIQSVIWYFICNAPYPTNDTLAQAMIADANASGNDFVPLSGQKIAILVDGIHTNYSIQRMFFELTLPSLVPIGDLVWDDYNADGIQDAGEPGIPGITIGLYTQNGTQVDSVTTDSHGYYSFGIFPPGEYYIQFTLAPGYRFSPVHQGTDDTKDSDVDPQTGRTSLSFFDPDQFNTSWDAGMYVPVPGSLGTPIPQDESNHPPTADGTAGEPYQGSAGEEIRFNGSLSYDRDGTIVSWHWSFGDGTTANGAVVTHAYTAAGSYTVALTVTDNDGATDTFTTIALIKVANQPPLPPQITGPLEGYRNTSNSYSVVTTDPDGDDVLYVINWGDGSQNTTSSYRSGHMIQLVHQWSAFGFYLVRVSAHDSSNATSDASEVLVSIDVQYVGNLGYLINVDGVGPFDMFYSNATGKQTVVYLESNGDYLIDTNGTGSFNYVYNAQTSALQANSGALRSMYIMLVVGFIVVIFFVVLVAIVVNRKKGKHPK